MRKAVLIALAIALLVLPACRRKKSAPNANAVNAVAVRAVRLYYESPAMQLVAESRNLQLSQNPAAAIGAVSRELLKGSISPAVPRLFPADTVVRAAFLLPDGTAFVDLGGPTLTQGWSTGSHQELMAVYSLVQTLAANFPEVKRVRILLNDTPVETLGGHVSLEQALVPNRAFVDPRF